MPSQKSAPAGESPEPERPQNTWGPIALAFVVLIVSTIVVVAGSLIFRDGAPEGAAPGATTSPSASPSLPAG